MENEQNQTQKLSQTDREDNNTTGTLTEWLNFSKHIPVGVFYCDSGNGVVHINARMREHLNLDQMEISPVLEEYFWLRMESIAQEEGQVHDLIVDAKNRINKEPNLEFHLTNGKNSYLQVNLLKVDLRGSGDRSYAGTAVQVQDGRTAHKAQLKMLEEMSVQARKTSASAVGNLDALQGNFQVWNSDILDGFLRDIRDQQQLVNQSLDLMLNLIKTVDSLSIITDTVNIREFLAEFISKQNQFELRFAEGQDQDPKPLSSLMDPALFQLALEYLMNEIANDNPQRQPWDISISTKEQNLIIKLECPRTLPLPGIISDHDKITLTGQNIRIYLANKIIAAQGGSLTVFGAETGLNSISGIAIELPIAVEPQPILKSDISLKLEAFQAIGGGRILVAEAQPEYQIRIRDTFQTAGYRVDLAQDGSSALDMARTINPDLIILARNLPGLDGLLVTQGIRRWSTIPVLMLSERVNPDDLIYAYHLGVDDYLRKPFSMQELMARVQVCIRRSEFARYPIAPDVFQSNQIRIDYSSRQVWVRGIVVDLTPIEYNLLVFMSRQGNQIMSYEQLLDSVWEGPVKGTRQGLFVHVKRLRKKIEQDPKNPIIITNKWGVGYEFNP